MEQKTIHIVIIEKNTRKDWGQLLSLLDIESDLSSNLEEITKHFTFPITICCEKNYVDQFYRDLYYSYYAGKFIPYSRNCVRLSLFTGRLTEDLFYTYSQSAQETLQDCFVGNLILRPLHQGAIGRTYISVKKINIPACFVAATTFNFVILGHELSVLAYPFSQQDQEFLTCSETVLWNITEFFGTKYPNYKTLLPSRIIEEKKKIQSERAIPSSGIDIYDFSRILLSLDFSPRIYELPIYLIDKLSTMEDSEIKTLYEEEALFRRSVYYYVESGIPISLALLKSNSRADHMITCVGHTKRVVKNIDYSKVFFLNNAPYILTADLHNEYVVVDDNKIPYTFEKLNFLAPFSNNSFQAEKIDGALVASYVVPLYKRILMDAYQAETYIRQVLGQKQWSFARFIEQEVISKDNPIVIRIFLTSSRLFKAYRSFSSSSKYESAFYAKQNFPKYIWVAELSTYDKYKEGKVQGEILLDATYPIDMFKGNSDSTLDPILLVRYLNNICRFGQKHLEIQSEFFEDMNLNIEFEQFNQNLVKGGIEQ